MSLNRLQKLAKRENLNNKYLVELFYGDDFEGFWQETARCTNATDVLNFLDSDLVSGMRVLDIETDEVIYQVDYKAPTNTLYFKVHELMRDTYANN